MEYTNFAHNSKAMGSDSDSTALVKDTNAVAEFN